MQIVTPKVELMAVTPNAEALIYSALRQCYSELFAIDIFLDNIPLFLNEIGVDQKRKVIQTVFESGHTSVTEHVNFTFAISGVSRAFSHQGVRTRHSTVSQQSQRYVIFSGQFPFVLPKTIEDSGMGADYIKHMEETAKFYDKMVVAGVPAEDARFVLPNATATAYVVTMNCVALAHTFGLRRCQRAQWEYRLVVNQMYKICKELVPSVFELVGPRCEMLGYCPEKNSCGRVIKKSDLLEQAKLYRDSQKG